MVGTAEDSLDLVGNVSRQPLPRRRLPRLAGEIAILRSLLPCFLLGGHFFYSVLPAVSDRLDAADISHQHICYFFGSRVKPCV